MSNSPMKAWSDYKPSKTIWLWSCVGAAVLTMIVGFTAGGWVTQNTAAKQAEASTSAAVAQLAAGICVHRFMAAPDAQAKLAALKSADSWKRDSIIEKGGWVTFADAKAPVDGAADLCASKLMQSSEAAATTAMPRTSGDS
ncbi:hypothetical protein [Bordetella petrii]|uniref:Uncharacterized protein n=1 Tax=Bordetella petrii (strain ATCC BAA-461 / DSM 12804 / CCUG 43448 / CIP 107267 / Se-1111R) TaxID=340100 RepID=A9IPS1_BORPD|nr:hypothetical protein [Bordetella petrii]CAP42978.1 hypothetical protein Bpet2636 [Bordetella petrii]